MITKLIGFGIYHKIKISTFKKHFKILQNALILPENITVCLAFKFIKHIDIKAKANTLW